MERRIQANVNTVDSQHKNLFRMAEFDRAVLARTGKTKLFQLLEDLTVYPGAFCLRGLMEEAAYP
jgi:hemerythrin